MAAKPETPRGRLAPWSHSSRLENSQRLERMVGGTQGPAFGLTDGGGHTHPIRGTATGARRMISRA